jgi:hypothetical protein
MNSIQPQNPVNQFFQDVIQVLTEPRLFFKDRYPQVTSNYALVFAVIVSWIASLLEWMVRTVRNESLFGGLTEIRNQLESLPFWKAVSPHVFDQLSTVSSFPMWLMELSNIALNPFKTLISLAMAALFIWLAAGMLMSKSAETRDPIDFNSFLKLICFASTAPKLVGAILSFLPLQMGSFFGAVFAFFLQAFAIHLRYQVSGLRAITIIILPGLIFSMAAACLLGAVFALLFGAFA